MKWIAEIEKRWQDARKRDPVIEEQATRIYDALWKKIFDGVTDARSVDRFSGLMTNGRPLAHVISFPADESPQARGIEIALLESEHLILASGLGGAEIDIRFDLDVCEDNSVCLMSDGERISYENAAILVLTAFLYPGLKPLKRQVPMMVAHKGGRRITG
ncbi:MAG: hypothetical protein M3P06_23490 [Acidobacteriota bacterium]|nr:hypothetical protein [Acidobacteriota bacterium]